MQPQKSYRYSGRGCPDVSPVNDVRILLLTRCNIGKRTGDNDVEEESTKRTTGNYIIDKNKFYERT
jgi:hypothetical protein